MKVAREGWPFVAVPGVIAVGLLVLGRRRLATPFAAASLASLGFFRDPDRTPPAVADAVLSPADGRVVDVVRVQDPFVGDAFRVSFFLSPLDVHVIRAPIAGLVVTRRYEPGRFLGGFRALILRVQPRYDQAARAIFVAIVMDMLDGRIARLMGATSQFGVEFDSLADVVSFCVAPAFLLYTSALSSLGRPAWLGAFLFVICGALRLARFNVHTGTGDRRFFVGLPTPAAAGLVAATVLLVGGEPPRWALVGIAAA